MKTNLLLALFAVLLSASSCSVNLGEGSERIEPSSKIVKTKYPMDAFDKVESHVVGNIQLVQSDQSRVTLSAPENYVDLFSVNNDHGKLEINFAKDNINIDASNITFIVYTPNLHKVKNSGAADIRVDSLTTDELEIDNSGVGAFELADIRAREVEVKCSGVGSIKLSGKTEEAEYECSGVGSINAVDLKALRVEAVVSGVGGIKCFASDFIKGRVTGVGSLEYAGNPRGAELNKDTMVGSIKKL